MQTVGIENWQEYRYHGEQFLQTALTAHANGRRHFTPEILYNLTGMAMEKLIMACLMKKGELAAHHTMIDMLASLERHVGRQPDLAERLKYFDSFQEICDTDTFCLKKPDDEEIKMLLATGQMVRDFLSPFLVD